MRPVCIYLYGLLTVTGVLCQLTLLEFGPANLKPSETLRLTCKVTGSMSGNYCWHWVRQAPGKGLEWLARTCWEGSINYSQSLKDRLSITKDTAKNEFYLQMTGMRSEDTARYYGARDQHSERKEVGVHTNTAFEMSLMHSE
ncbi:hypothetical protein NDU88_003831 [Pleurodeles waltl]|uniref:Immunoglobulin V-set domain-containing protein n=1 Tax=Pleurodeles waltl TaxID=8319 RepID=A0AAV7QB66_PLEWA|nr:hypothetical protein NDU88_003831 [Pleurodeles waltl]